MRTTYSHGEMRRERGKGKGGREKDTAASKTKLKLISCEFGRRILRETAKRKKSEKKEEGGRKNSQVMLRLSRGRLRQDGTAAPSQGEKGPQDFPMSKYARRTRSRGGGGRGEDKEEEEKKKEDPVFASAAVILSFFPSRSCNKFI